MKTHPFDAVVVGSGLAGMTCALELVEEHQFARVALVTKARLGAGAASAWAQGGVAVALPADDKPELHAQDTLNVGGGLNHPREVAILTSEGPRAVLDLVERGAQFDRDNEGHFEFAREAAHCRRRVLHAKDATGAEMVRALVAQIRALGDRIEVWEESFVLELEKREGRICGALVARQGEIERCASPVVVLATGGCGQIYAYTTNPAEATGDGLALAYRAGARLRDLEFVQFHPTALEVGKSGALSQPLITEAIRGEGARLVDENGDRFVDKYGCAQGELSPRDQVARAIWFHRREGHRTLLDATHLGQAFHEHFPNVARSCAEVGVDPAVQPIPVVPAAHYHMGGVEVDEWGRTSIRGLWACGEVASTGVHGANRLASNSLLEALVFGSRVARDVAQLQLAPLAAAAGGASELCAQWRASEVDTMIGQRLREVMWDKVGLARTQVGLQQAIAQLAGLEKRLACPHGEVANLLTVAQLVAQSALARSESRGAHHRLDYPEARPDWAVHLVAELGWGQPQPVALPGLERVS